MDGAQFSDPIGVARRVTEPTFFESRELGRTRNAGLKLQVVDLKGC